MEVSIERNAEKETSARVTAVPESDTVKPLSGDDHAIAQSLNEILVLSKLAISVQEIIRKNFQVN